MPHKPGGLSKSHWVRANGKWFRRVTVPEVVWSTATMQSRGRIQAVNVRATSTLALSEEWFWHHPWRRMAVVRLAGSPQLGFPIGEVSGRLSATSHETDYAPDSNTSPWAPPPRDWNGVRRCVARVDGLHDCPKNGYRARAHRQSLVPGWKTNTTRAGCFAAESHAVRGCLLRQDD